MSLLANNDISDLSDDKLIELAKTRGDKDPRPFRLLVERHQQTVWRVCYNFMSNHEDAEDLSQEVFVKAYRNLAKFEGRSSFKTWIYRIAINTSQNELRRRSRRPQVSTTPLETAAEFIPSTENVEEHTLQRSRQALLVKAFKLLRPEESRILMLKDLEGRPYAEIAEELGISLSAAKMRVQRARSALTTTFHRIADTKEPA